MLGLSSGVGSEFVDGRANAQEDQASDQEAQTDADKKLSRGERRRQRIMAEYEATGKVESCVPMRSLRQSHILDDQTIFFESNSKRGYINRLTSRCAGLEREERYAYSNSFGSICRGQIITVLDNFGRAWGSCGMGDFEEYKKISNDKPAD